jgi:hypothetical protein
MKILHAIDQLKMGGAQNQILTILKEMLFSRFFHKQ